MIYSKTSTFNSRLDIIICFKLNLSTKNVVKERHEPRIKISNIRNTFSDFDNFAVTIERSPRIVAGKTKFKQDEVNDIYDWVKLNYIPLMKYWNNEYDRDLYFYQDLKRI